MVTVIFSTIRGRLLWFEVGMFPFHRERRKVYRNEENPNTNASFQNFQNNNPFFNFSFFYWVFRVAYTVSFSLNTRPLTNEFRCSAFYIKTSNDVMLLLLWVNVGRSTVVGKCILPRNTKLMPSKAWTQILGSRVQRALLLDKVLTWN